MTNHLAALERHISSECNERHVSNTINNVSSRVVIDEHIPINETTGLSKSLTACVGARVMFTCNEGIEDKFLMDQRNQSSMLMGLEILNLLVLIKVQFDNPSTGIKLKDNR